MKPPAFQFYADDFLAGTLEMSQSEVGAYIRLLCVQWNRGSIPVEPEKLDRLAGGPVSADVIAKFDKSEDGLLRQHRLEEVRKKQRQFSESQRAKGLKSAAARSTPAEPRLNPGSNPVAVRSEPNVNSPISDLRSPSTLSVGTPREGGDSEIEPPRGFPRSESEAVASAAMAGVPDAFASTEYNRLLGRGYRDAKGVLITNWRGFIKACHNTSVSINAERAVRKRPESNQIQENIQIKILNP